MATNRDESVILAAFDALRDPANDPGGFGRGFFVTTIKVNGVDRWTICAKVDNSILPLFFALVPGDRVNVDGVDRIVGPGLGYGRKV